MKQSIKLFVVAAFMLLSVESQATSWRVCSKPEARANFTSVRDAVASLEVFAGDTLYVEPGHIESSNSELNINKRLIIIGPGYHMNSNNITVMNPSEATFDVNVSLSATGTNIYGCVFLRTLAVSSSVHIIERCLISGSNIHFSTNCNDINIRNNFFNNSNITTGTSSISSSRVYSSVFENNIILGRITSSSYWPYNSCTFRNNTIIYFGADANYLIHFTTNCQIYNNILLHVTSGYTTTTTSNQTVDTSWYRDRVLTANDGEGNDVHHNILSSQINTQYRNCIFNIQTCEAALIWNNATSVEEKYKHIANGIAVGAGSNGTTIGAYGAVNGSIPYIPSGIPQYRPYIYDANIDQTPSSNNTINASFKIKVQND